MTTVQSRKEAVLMAHLLRRAGFGATPSEMDEALSKGYDKTLDELLNPDHADVIPDDLIRRYHVDLSDLRSGGGPHWVYRLVMTDTPLREKMCLFWHRIFATASTKLIQSRVVTNQVSMFREHGMSSFDNLLIQLSKDPAMIMWLDNQDNHGSNINENYGREILELFAMGVGNYTEEDIQETSRAFTGWRIVNPDYMSIRMRNNTARPYGYMSWQFEYDDDDHDHGEKTILGQTGNWNGEDAVRIICEQEATARFLARHLYHFFVADELPVPQWPHEDPIDPNAIEFIIESYFKHKYNIKEVLRDLFKSEYFKTEAIYNKRIKSPTEVVVNTVRLSGGLDINSQEVYKATGSSRLMGQPLMDPTSVEGWQGGEEWINTGSVIERINFCSEILGDVNKDVVTNIVKQNPNKKNVLNLCLEELGYSKLERSTKIPIEEYIENSLPESIDSEEVSLIIKLIVSTREFQMN